MKEIAIVSDIHGNSFALKEVIKDIKERGIEKIINLGDSLYGPLDPKGTFELLKENQIESISGNQDRYIVENWNKESKSHTLEYVKSQMNGEGVSWLKSLPFDIIVNNDIYCCHASPQSDSEYLLEKLEIAYTGVKDRIVLEKLVKKVNQNMIVCGHSHVSRIVFTGKKYIINAGSVGLPAYNDDLPVFHKMENFSPNSNYITLCKKNDFYKINRISVEYDYKKAAELAEANNRKDWAEWLSSGTAR